MTFFRSDTGQTYQDLAALKQAATTAVDGSLRLLERYQHNKRPLPTGAITEFYQSLLALRDFWAALEEDHSSHGPIRPPTVRPIIRRRNEG